MRVLRQCHLLALYLWKDTVVSGSSLQPFARPWCCCLDGVHCCNTPPSKRSHVRGTHFPFSPSLAILLFSPVGYFGASIPDGVASLQANPLGDGPVLLLGLGQLLLGAERLVGLSQRLARRVHGMLEFSCCSRSFGVRTGILTVSGCLLWLLVGGRLVSLSRSRTLSVKFEDREVRELIRGSARGKWEAPRSRFRRHVHSTSNVHMFIDQPISIYK